MESEKKKDEASPKQEVQEEPKGSARQPGAAAEEEEEGAPAPAAQGGAGAGAAAPEQKSAPAPAPAPAEEPAEEPSPPPPGTAERGAPGTPGEGAAAGAAAAAEAAGTAAGAAPAPGAGEGEGAGAGADRRKSSVPAIQLTVSKSVAAAEEAAEGGGGPGGGSSPAPKEGGGGGGGGGTGPNTARRALAAKASSIYDDSPWEPPSLKEAQQYGQDLKWRRGEGALCGVRPKDLGEMGVGVYLYFYVLGAVGLVFLGLALLGAPSLYFSAVGTGHLNSTALSSNEILEYLSIANLGDCVTDADGATTVCGKSTLDAGVFGTLDFRDITYVISGMEFGIALLWMIVFGWLKDRIGQIQVEMDAEHVSPADFALYVRGIPKDATCKDLAEFFSERYDLSKEQPSYPAMGLSRGGTMLFWGLVAGVVALAAGGPSFVLLLGGAVGGGTAVGVGVGAGLVAAGVVYAAGVGKPVLRPTPLARYEADLALVLADVERREANRRRKKKIQDAVEQAVEAVEEAVEEGLEKAEEGAGALGHKLEEGAATAAAAAAAAAAAKTGQVVPVNYDAGEEKEEGGGGGDAEKEPVDMGSAVRNPPAGDVPVSPERPPAVADGAGGDPSGGEEKPGAGAGTGATDNGDGEEGGGGGGGGEKEGPAAAAAGPRPAQDSTGVLMADAEAALAEGGGAGGGGGGGNSGEEGAAAARLKGGGGTSGQEARGASSATPRSKSGSGGSSSSSPAAADTKKAPLAPQASSLSADLQSRPSTGVLARLASTQSAASAAPRALDPETAKRIPMVGKTPVLVPPPPRCVPVADALRTPSGLALYTDKWVADVRLSHPAGPIIRDVRSKEKLLKKFMRVQRTVKKWEAKGKPKKVTKSKKKMEGLKKKMDKLEKKTEKYNIHLMTQTDAAFVSFNNEESQARACEDYRFSGHWFWRRFQPDRLMFTKETHVDKKTGKLKKFPLVVQEAAEPSNVLWENLEVGWKEKLLRRALTALLTLALLVASFAVIYYAQLQKEQVAESMPDLTVCDTELPAVFFGTYEGSTANASITHVSGLDGSCDGGFYLTYNNVTVADLPELMVPGGNGTAFFPRANATGLCDGGCYSSSSSTSCEYLSCAVEGWQESEYGAYECSTYQASTTVGCYCLQDLTDSISSMGVLAGVRHVYTDSWEVCGTFAGDYLLAVVLQIVSAVVVVFVNTLLKTILVGLAKFERHASVSAEASAVTIKIAFAQFLNTAIITLIVNSNISSISSVGWVSQVGLFSGSYDDFTREWYNSVGVALILTMLMNVVVPHIAPLMKSVVLLPLKRLALRGSAVSQDALNALHEQPAFEIQTRYAFMINCVFVTMVYGAGLPALYPVAALTMAVAYGADLLFVVKLNKQPPHYDCSLANMFVSVMPLAIIMHMAMTIYMFGNHQIFGYNISDYVVSLKDTSNPFWNLVAPKVLQTHCLPLFVLLVVYVACLLAYKTFGQVLVALLKNTLGALCSGCGKYVPELDGLKATLTDPMEVTMPEKVFKRAFKKGGQLPKEYRKEGWEPVNQAGPVPPAMRKVWKETTFLGTHHNAGDPQLTWEYLAEQGLHSYQIDLNKDYEKACAFLYEFMAKHNVRRRSVGADEEDLEQGGQHKATEEAAAEAARAAAEEGGAAGEVQVGGGDAPSLEAAGTTVVAEKTKEGPATDSQQEKEPGQPLSTAQGEGSAAAAAAAGGGKEESLALESVASEEREGPPAAEEGGAGATPAGAASSGGGEGAAAAAAAAAGRREGGGEEQVDQEAFAHGCLPPPDANAGEPREQRTGEEAAAGSVGGEGEEGGEKKEAGAAAATVEE